MIQILIMSNANYFKKEKVVFQLNNRDATDFNINNTILG